jgi:hypothetical protein
MQVAVVELLAPVQVLPQMAVGHIPQVELLVVELQIVAVVGLLGMVSILLVTAVAVLLLLNTP